MAVEAEGGGREGYLLPASALTPAFHPLRNSLKACAQADASNFRSFSSPKLPKSGSTRAESSPTSGRASEVTVVPLEIGSVGSRSHSEGKFPEQVISELEERLERQRLQHEQERQMWLNQQQLLQCRVARLQAEKSQLLQSLESLARSLPPTFSHLAAEQLAGGP
ncbi:unnamed protein product [Durusdinium trenchii]|uniref:Uncharacterized protein n=1 Tax=Durusdinium trenchii TaxID=1381693 RepID=A0ABP0LNH3_9DINO